MIRVFDRLSEVKCVRFFINLGIYLIFMLLSFNFFKLWILVLLMVDNIFGE